MFITLVNNITLLIVMSYCNFLILQKFQINTLRYKITSGLLSGLITIIGMMNAFVLAEGIIFDGRSMLVSMAGLFGGPITALVVVIIAGFYRALVIGGSGALMGIMVLVTSAGLGAVLHQWGKKHIVCTSYLFLFLFGFVVHILMLLWMLLLPASQAGFVFRSISVPILTLYPIGTVILGKLLYNQEISLHASQELHNSEERYRSLFENNHAVMLVIDPQDGQIIDANPGACRFYGYERKAIQQMKMEQINLLSQPEILIEIKKAKEAKINYFLFKHRLANGEIRDVEVYSGPIRYQDRSYLYSIVFDVTDKKVLEDHLKESEQRYRLLIENAPDGIFVQIDSKFAFMNKSLIQMLGGKTQEDFIGCSIYDLFPPDVHEIVRSRIQTLNKKQQRVGYHEYDLIGLNGQVVPVEISGVPIHLNNQDGALVFVRNIQERVVHERLLKESEERFRKALSESPFPIAIHNEEGKFLFINKAWEELSGYSYSEIPTIDAWLTQVYGDRKEIVKKGIEALYGLKERVDEGEFEIITKTGEKRVWDFSTAPLGQDKDGVRLVISVAKDVTEHKKVEIQQRKLLTAIEQSMDAFVITDSEGHIQYVNPAFENITGYSSAEVLGKTPRILKSDRHEESFYKNIWETITRGKTWSGRIVNKKKDGTLYYDQTTISPVFDSFGSIVNYASAKRDVTHETEMETQLRQAQKMESIGHMAGGIAHDFNNILTAIMGYTDMARFYVNREDPLDQYLTQIEKATLRAANLTRQILAFSRKQILKPEVLDLNEMILNIDKMLCRLIGEDIEYNTLPCEGLWKVKADVGQLEQVVTNLIVNARDAMHRGGTITIETKNVILDEEYAKVHMEALPGEYVMLAVSDTGTGIKKEILDKIFDPFFTTKETGKGTGLGLSMVHGIVKQSGGNIFVYSEEGRGTTFKIYLPRIVHETEAESVVEETVPICYGSETILMVEDDEILRTLIHRSVENAGYTVLAASYASEAIDIFEKSDVPIHLLLTDVVMPKVSGKDLAQVLVKKNPRLKVLFMSGYTDNAIVHHGILDEGVEFIQKPFIPQDLLAKIRAVLDRESKMKML